MELLMMFLFCCCWAMRTVDAGSCFDIQDNSTVRYVDASDCPHGCCNGLECGSESACRAIWVIVVAVIAGVVGLVIVIAVLTCYCCKCCCFMPKTPPIQKVNVTQGQPVTGYPAYPPAVAPVYPPATAEPCYPQQNPIDPNTQC